MLASSALISYSRALTKLETSRSPFWLRAFSDVWVRIVRGEGLTRFMGRLEKGSELCFLLRFGFGGMAGVCSKYTQMRVVRDLVK